MKRAPILILCGLLTAQPLSARREAGATGGAALAAKGPAAPAARATVSFRNELLPLFRDNCTMCHQGDTPMGALSLTPDAAYENLVGMQSAESTMVRVMAGHPERSYLYYKVSGQNARVKGGGIGMPWARQLSPSDVDLVRRWIRQGARNN